MGCDRISTLPQSLLTHILSYVATKDSVTTSVLSKRWKSLWLNVPVLDLNCDDYPPYGEVPKGSTCYIDKYLEFNEGSRMQKLKLQYDDVSDYRENFVEWIETMVDRGLQHLDVETVMDRSFRDAMPENIYTSKTLVSLKLVSVGLMNPDPELGVLLPCLKVLHLEDILYDDDDDASVLEKLISGCPVLEELKLAFPYYHNELQNLSFVRVRSQTLKSFDHWFEFNDESRNFAVEIDAPELTYMNFSDFQSERIVVKNLSSLSMIDIDSNFNVKYGRTMRRSRKRDIIRDFLTGISSVRHMIISEYTLEVLFDYSRLGPIPKFSNLYRLQAALSSFMLVLLPAFLESFPNLNNLILDLSVSRETTNIKLRHVPQCLLSSLECVEIKELTMVEETVKKLVRYFLENSAVLKKLILRFKDSSKANKKKDSSKANQHSEDLFKEFRTFAKLSRSCQIIIH